MPSPLVLISTPIDLGKIKLGNLVPNIGQPHIDAFEPSALTEDAIHISEQLNFKTQLEQSKGSNLESALTKLLSASWSNKRTQSLNLSASKAMCYEVKHPLSFFKDIISQQPTRMRLQDAIEKGHNMYMVTALRTVIDAEVAQCTSTTKGISFGAGIPVGAILAGGIDITNGMADLNFNTGRDDHIRQKQSYMSPSEQVYAVGYRRIEFKWFCSKTVDKAFLEVRNRWKVIGEETMGEEDEDEEDLIEADLEDSFLEDDILHLETIPN